MKPYHRVNTPMRNILLSLSFAFTIISCSRIDIRSSSTNEAPDSRNLVSRFGIDSMPSYDEIFATKSVFTTKVPWSDSYWPLTEASISRRWKELSENPSKLGFASFWKDQFEETSTEIINPNLSPAEKYDAVYRLRWRKPINENTLKREIASLETLENNFDPSGTLASKRSVVSSLYSAFSVSTEIRKWSPLATTGWESWLSYNKNSRYQFLTEPNTGEDWRWMGACAGWTPASLTYDPPKRSVLVKVAGKEILFGEGDIRGLLTRAWDDHAPSEAENFIGRRCNENIMDPEGAIPSNKDGRGVTGTYFSTSGTQRTFTMLDEYVTSLASQGLRIYQVEVKGDTRVAYLIEQFKNSDYTFHVAANIEQVREYIEKNITTNLSEVTGVKFYGCWDTNPASFHTVLLEYIGKRNIGFVMDRTRTGQVWNQPVYGANFVIGPLLEAATVDDVMFRYRAPGTVYLSVITAEIKWSSEPAKPSFDYPLSFDKDRIRSSKYTYTLEFDVNKKLIGGEWGDLTTKDPEMIIPDFLFAYDQGSEPRNRLDMAFDFTGIIRPIYDCSQSSSDVRTMTHDGKILEYSVCEIETQ